MRAEPLVTVVAVSERATAVRRARTSWRAYPALWPQLLGEVYANVRWEGAGRPGRNVMLYRDVLCCDAPHCDAPRCADGRCADGHCADGHGVPGVDVEVGVELDRPASVRVPVVRSTLPAGTAARIEHRGRYEDLGRSHDAVLAWCAGQGLVTTGTRWEVYGHHQDDPAQQLTDVFHLLGS